MSIVYPSRCFRCVTVAIYLIFHFISVFQFKIPLQNEPQNKLAWSSKKYSSVIIIDEHCCKSQLISYSSTIIDWLSIWNRSCIDLGFELINLLDRKGSWLMV